MSLIAVTGAADADVGGTVRYGRRSEERRLLWHCRRGMKELDVLLERFALEALPQASPEEREAFAELLELPDPVLAACLLAGRPPPHVHLKELVRRIRRA